MPKGRKNKIKKILNAKWKPKLAQMCASHNGLFPILTHLKKKKKKNYIKTYKKIDIMRIIYM